MALLAPSQCSPRDSFWRHVRFDEPELMIDAARYSGEEIGGVGVAEDLGLPDRVARRLPKRGKRRSDREYVLVFVSDAQRIGDEEGALGRDLDGAFRDAAETGGALGDQVGIAGRLAGDVRKALEGAGCELPRGFSVEVKTAELGDRAFEISCGTAVPAALTTASLVVVKGKAESDLFSISKPRTNIGRLAELTDRQSRVVRRNDVVFLEGGDQANATVSRQHAHIQLAAGEYRIADDGSEFGTRIFRDGRSIDVPAGNRGEKLCPGDEIQLGRACLRFRQ